MVVVSRHQVWCDAVSVLGIPMAFCSFDLLAGSVWAVATEHGHRFYNVAWC
jgi:hypothetical protein